jgi:GTPase involved in cell partitioning and DNA repair
MSISDYYETTLLKALRNESPAVAAVYVKLHKGDPGEAGTSNAATETTRKQVTFAAPSGGVIKNSNAPEWTNVSTTETISHVSLWDNSTAGNCLWSGALTAPRSLTAGDNLLIKAEQLSVSLS